MVAMSNLFDYLLTHRQFSRRWFLAWLNAAQLVFTMNILGNLLKTFLLLWTSTGIYWKHFFDWTYWGIYLKLFSDYKHSRKFIENIFLTMNILGNLFKTLFDYEHPRKFIENIFFLLWTSMWIYWKPFFDYEHTGEFI